MSRAQRGAGRRRGPWRHDGPDRAVPTGQAQPLVDLASRMIVAQTVSSAVVGLLYSRRHLPSIIITLTLVAVLWVLALLVRSGAHAAWLTAVGVETSYLLFGLYRFATSRYLGGTLFAIITLAVLARPSVARAFGGQPGRADRGLSEGGLSGTAGGPLGG
ncbi:MAG: hypothetical protein ABJB47_22830 [Actinomycetota bacterium]